MILQLECDNQLIFKTFFNLLSQKNFIIKKEKNLYYPRIKIEDKNEKLIIVINDLNKVYIKPLELNFIFSDLMREIIKISFKINKFFYFPFQRKVKNEKLKTYLSDIQNKILLNLLTNQNGINKDKLYQIIWSQDKTISINKLDTHLTNLKSLLIDELNLKINFRSENKKLKLIIN